jgi:site-specific DNA-methyltransferase (adenine-specific)
MNIEIMPINLLKPYANNPRDNKKAVDKVAESLKTYGWQQPIVADQDKTIIVGHTRWLAAQKLG